jgi:cell filamentation protein
VSIAKGSVFCLPQHLESYAADVFGRLAAADRLRGVARDPFITALAGSSLKSPPLSCGEAAADG